VDADNRRTFGGDISIFTPCLESGVGVFLFSPGVEAVLKIIITSVEAGGNGGLFRGLPSEKTYFTQNI